MVNIYDVAKEAGVSIATVSNIINKKNREVGKETGKRVLNAIEKLNYIPSKAAKKLATGKTYIIGVVISDITNPFFSELFRNIEDILYGSNFDLLLTDTKYNLEKSAELVNRLLGEKVDGILLLNDEIDTKIVEILSKNEIPTALYHWGINDSYVCNLKIDFLKGIEAAINYLYKLNHRDIVFIKSNKKLKGFIDREIAFIKAIEKLNFKDLKFKIFEGDSTVLGGQKVIKNILSDKSFKPTAIMGVNDIQMIGALFFLYNKGFKVPEDVSLIGLDNIFISSVVVPKLTTIDLSPKRVGKNIIGMLFNLIENEDKEGFEKIIETKLIPRDSTRKIN